MIANKAVFQSRLWNAYQRSNHVFPPHHGRSKQTIQIISHAIHRRLTTVIPSTNTVLIDMIEPFGKDRNGYACLWSLMRHTCAYMKPEPEGWGPDWLANETTEKYVVKLQAYCCITNSR